jgi:hypothetical protein
MGIPLPALSTQPPPNPLDQYAKALSIKSMIGQQETQQLQQQGLRQENQQRQMQIDDANGQKRALIDANGDFETFQKNISDPKYGISVPGQLDMSNKIMAHQKAFYELDESKLSDAQKKATGMAGHLQPLTQLDDWDAVQKALPKVVNAALLDGTATQSEVQQLQHINNMDDLKMHVSGLQMIGDQVKQAQDNRKTGIEAWKEVPGTGTMQNVDATDKANFGKTMPITNAVPVPKELAAALGAPELANKPTTPQMLKTYKEAADQGNKVENFNGTMNLIDSTGKTLKVLGTAPAVTTFNMGQNALQGDALDQSADRYLQTGQLPAGMRSPGMAAAIINRAAQRGQGQSIAANTAAYGANKASYDNVTKTLDTLSGFENAAVKNIDMFKSLTSKLPDSGVPWINTPLRLLDEKAVGAEWMPAINAAREIANREVARVTNDPKLAGVLSDSARQEVSSMNPKDATLAQIMHVTDLMKQDMANVHSSLAMQKDDIGKRLGIQSGSNAAPKTISQAQLAQAAKDHNVSIEEATRQAKAAGIQVQP